MTAALPTSPVHYRRPADRQRAPLLHLCAAEPYRHGPCGVPGLLHRLCAGYLPAALFGHTRSTTAAAPATASALSPACMKAPRACVPTTPSSSAGHDHHRRTGYLRDRRGRHPHENELECIDLGDNQYGHWLGFAPLTLVPIDTAPVLVGAEPRPDHLAEQLPRPRKRNAQPRLTEDEKVWLKKKCAPIGR